MNDSGPAWARTAAIDNHRTLTELLLSYGLRVDRRRSADASA